MLTSSANQYLRPEYLTPLPTTLDAKKSPLALLAQTCSQIGADSPSSKSIIPPIEKPKKSDTPREKSTPPSSGDNKSSFKPYESCKDKNIDVGMEDRGSSGGSGGSGNRSRTPISKSITPATTSNSHNSSPSSPATGTTAGRKTPASSEGASTAKVSSESTSVTRAVPSPISSTAATSKSSFTSLLSSDPALKDLPLGTFKPGLPAGFLGYPGCLTAAHLPMDVAVSNSAAASSLAAGLGLMSQAGALHLKPGLNPYIGYARMKTANGAETLVPVCRDPYCTGCQLSSQSAHLLKGSPCPSGCVQCDHQKNGLSGLPSLVPGLNPAVSSANHLAAYTQHSLLTSHMPYVCNWIAADTYCGKRFSTSEELLQHLRTHTNLSTSAESSAALSLLNPGLPNHPLLASPAALHRTYPTPPLSPLATARFHPYSKPHLGLPTFSGASLGAAFPLHPHPGVPPYFSPYSLYGQRLGAATGMHP